MIKFKDILLEKERDLTPLLLRTTNVKAFVNAVTNRNPISFDYYGPRKGRDSVKSGSRKKVEGVVLGLNKKGKMTLRAYVNPPSVSKKGFEGTHWRTYILSRMKNIVFHSDEQFNTKREDYEEGTDGSMTTIYAKSDWGAKLKDKKISRTKVEPEVEPKPEKPEIEPQVAPVEPTAPEVQPTAEPEVQPTAEPVAEPTNEPIEPIAKPTTQTIQPPVEKNAEAQKQKLPQPKPAQKPSVNPEEPSIENPEEENDETLKECIKRIKCLMLL
jgi:hypothetical protein